MSDLKSRRGWGCRVRGFSLIELMVAVAIIAILASIAIPAYGDYIRRAKRSTAQSFMMNVANQQQQVFLDQRQFISVTANANFPNAPTAANPGVNLTVPAEVSAHYAFTVVAANPGNAPPTFQVRAAPQGDQAADTVCATLTLDQAGTKGITGTGTVQGCW